MLLSPEYFGRLIGQDSNWSYYFNHIKAFLCLCFLVPGKTKQSGRDSCSHQLCECDRQFAMCLNHHLPCPRNKLACRYKHNTEKSLQHHYFQRPNRPQIKWDKSLRHFLTQFPFAFVVRFVWTFWKNTKNWKFLVEWRSGLLEIWFGTKRTTTRARANHFPCFFLRVRILGKVCFSRLPKVN